MPFPLSDRIGSVPAAGDVWDSSVSTTTQTQQQPALITTEKVPAVSSEGTILSAPQDYHISTTDSQTCTKENGCAESGRENGEKENREIEEKKKDTEDKGKAHKDNDSACLVPGTIGGHLQQVFALLQFSQRRFIDPTPFINSLGLDAALQQVTRKCSINSQSASHDN